MISQSVISYKEGIHSLVGQPSSSKEKINIKKKMIISLLCIAA